MHRTLFSDEHDLFRDAFRTFVEREMVPNFLEWDRAGIVPASCSPPPGPRASSG